MKKKYSLLMLFVFFMIIFHSTASAQKENNVDKYKYRTLSEIVSFNKDSTDAILRKSKFEEKNDFIGVDLFHSRVRVQFTGKPRPISADHKDLIKMWGRLQKIDEKIINLYEEEILFKECDKEYWIPVQKKVSENFLKKVKLNDMVTLFVIHIGGRKEQMSKEFDWLFLSIEFEK